MPTPPLDLRAILDEAANLFPGTFGHRVVPELVAEIERLRALVPAEAPVTGLTNCSTCAHDWGDRCAVKRAGCAIAAWCDANMDGRGLGVPKRGATGCPGHKARS